MRQTPILACFLLVALLAGLLIPIIPISAQADQARPGMAERFPPGTLMVMRVQNVEQVRSWLATSPFHAMIQDPEVKPLWDQLTTMITGFAQKAEKQSGVNFLQMLDQIHGEVAIGLTKIRIAMPPVPGLMITIDCGADAQAFRKNLATLLQRIPEKAYRTVEREVKGVPVQVFSPVEQDNQRRRRGPAALGPIHVAWVDSVLVITNDRSAVDSFIAVSRQEDVPTLGATQNWKDTMDKLGGAGDITFYVNIRGAAELLEAASGSMPEEVGPVIAALGLDEFPAMGSATFLTKDAAVGRFLLRYTGDGKSGLGSLLSFKKADLTLPAWVPEDAWQVMILNYDFQNAFAGLLGIVDAAGEEPYENFQEGLEEFHNRFGISLQDDLLGALSNPMVIVRLTPTGQEPVLTSPRRGDFLPMGGAGPMLFGIKIRNRKTLETFLEYFENQGAVVSEYLGATIVSGPTLGGDQPMFEVALTDTHLLMGAGGTPIVRQVLQRMGGRDRGFAGSEGVRDALQDLPREGVGLVVYNYGKALSTGMNAMKMAMLISRRVEDLARFKIPNPAVLEKYLGHAAAVMLYEPGTGVIFDSSFRFKRGQ